MNPSPSVAMETLPNPFEGVNTHLLRSAAYMNGIVPTSSASYTGLHEDTTCSVLHGSLGLPIWEP